MCQKGGERKVHRIPFLPKQERYGEGWKVTCELKIKQITRTESNAKCLEFLDKCTKDKMKQN